MPRLRPVNAHKVLTVAEDVISTVNESPESIGLVGGDDQKPPALVLNFHGFASTERSVEHSVKIRA